MIFETSRLLVRHLNGQDLEELYKLYGDPAIMEYIRPALTMAETRHIFEEQLQQYNKEPVVGRYMIIEKTSGEMIGIFMLRKPPAHNGIEIGYSIRKQDWGKGYATEIVKKGIAYIFRSTEFSEVVAFTDVRNKRSKNVLSKCSFIYECDVMEDGKPASVFCLKRLAWDISAEEND